MTPAYMIALYLNVDCTDIKSFINNSELKKGSTRKGKFDYRLPQEAQNILVVDDSIYRGNSLRKDLALLEGKHQGKITSCAIYTSEKHRDDVDITLVYLPRPRAFEWNIFSHPVTENTCFDIDGVLCVDPTEEQNDDGEKYIDFILNAPPLFLPTKKVKALVTSRLEKYREPTEAWLEKHNIEYEQLIMMDLPSKAERQKLGSHGRHKGAFYRNSDTELFIESEYHQSLEILQIANKPVYCIETNTMLSPGGVYQLRTQSKTRLSSMMIRAAQFLPPKVKEVIKASLPARFKRA